MFNNGFHGDIVNAQVVIKALEKKTYAVPGVTCHPELSMSQNGETAYYYKRSTSTVAEGKVGDKHTYTAKGHTLENIPMVTSINIDAVMPAAQCELVNGIDPVSDKVAQESLTAANKYNEKFVAELEKSTASETLTAAVSADNVYNVILQAIKKYKIKNKATGVRPTGILVSPGVMAALREKNLLEFKDALPGGSEMVDGYFSKLPVIECVDMDSKVEFILINAEGFAAPQNLKVLTVADATAAGYPGPIRQEMILSA